MMQALWSRAAPSRTACRCRACFRGSTTAVSKRRLKIGDLFTACYSTILGTAVFADAGVKEARRKEWDRAIADVKAGRPSTAPVEQSSLLEGEPSKLWNILDAGKDWKESVTASYALEIKPWSIPLGPHLEQSIHKTSREASDDLLDNAHMMENFSGDRRPRTVEQVQRMEEMVSKLVTALLQQRKELTLPYNATPQNDTSQGVKEIMEQLESLHTSGQLPSFKPTHEYWRLNLSVKKLLSSIEEDSSNIDLVLAKICYNLLASPSPPNVSTYNMMIRYFNRLKLYQLSQAVVDSFLHDSKFLPTSETIQLLLSHYSGQKDKLGFRSIVDRMRAVKGDLRIKMRALDTLDKKGVQDWALSNKVTWRYNHLRQKVDRDSAIFDSLIHGFLELDMLKDVVRYFRAALREGKEVSSTTLLHIVEACIRVLDYKSGSLVLRVLLSQSEGDACGASQFAIKGSGRLAIHRLLALCGIRPDSVPSQLSHLRISYEALQNLRRCVAKFSTLDGKKFYEPRVRRAEALLGVSPTSAGPISTTSNGNGEEASTIIHSLGRHEHLRSERRKANNDQAKILRNANTGWVQQIERQKTKVVSNANTDWVHWLDLQYSRLKTTWQEEYRWIIERQPNLCWSERLEVLSQFQQGNNLPADHPLFTPLWYKEKKSSYRSIGYAFKPLQKAPQDTTQTFFRPGAKDDQFPLRKAAPLIHISHAYNSSTLQSPVAFAAHGEQWDYT